MSVCLGPAPSNKGASDGIELDKYFHISPGPLSLQRKLVGHDSLEILAIGITNTGGGRFFSSRNAFSWQQVSFFLQPEPESKFRYLHDIYSS